MHINTVGNILILLGALIFLGVAVADSLGFGGSSDFGPGQIIGLIFGPVIAFVGHSVKGQSE
jgi:hypothetical protein